MPDRPSAGAGGPIGGGRWWSSCHLRAGVAGGKAGASGYPVVEIGSTVPNTPVRFHVWWRVSPTTPSGEGGGAKAKVGGGLFGGQQNLGLLHFVLQGCPVWACGILMLTFPFCAHAVQGHDLPLLGAKRVRCLFGVLIAGMVRGAQSMYFLSRSRALADARKPLPGLDSTKYSRISDRAHHKRAKNWQPKQS